LMATLLSSAPSAPSGGYQIMRLLTFSVSYPLLFTDNIVR
jgi:hypothetical protein